MIHDDNLFSKVKDALKNVRYEYFNLNYSGRLEFKDELKGSLGSLEGCWAELYLDREGEDTVLLHVLPTHSILSSDKSKPSLWSVVSKEAFICRIIGQDKDIRIELLSTNRGSYYSPIQVYNDEDFDNHNQDAWLIPREVLKKDLSQLAIVFSEMLEKVKKLRNT